MARAGQQIENFDIGRVVSRGFEVLGAQALPFFGLALILSAPPAAMMGWWQVNLADSMQENPELALSWRFWGPFVIASAISIITNAILQATLSSAAVAHLEGDPPQIGSHLGNSIWMILPIILLSLISTLAIGLGLMLLIFPGFMLATAWAVIYPAYVRERPGIFGALARSADLRDYDLAGEVEPHAGPRGAGGEEGQEHVLAQALGNAGAIVLDFDYAIACASPAGAAPAAAGRSRASPAAALRIRLITTCASRSGSASSASVSGALTSSGMLGPLAAKSRASSSAQGRAAKRWRLISGVCADRAIGFDEVAQPLRAAGQRLDRHARIADARIGRQIGIAEQVGRGRRERGHRRQRVEDLVRQHADQIGLRRHLDCVERALDRLDADRAGALAEPFERRRAHQHPLRRGRRY
jgi:hypothetical protein